MKPGNTGKNPVNTGKNLVIPLHENLVRPLKPGKTVKDPVIPVKTW